MNNETLLVDIGNTNIKFKKYNSNKTTTIKATSISNNILPKHESSIISNVNSSKFIDYFNNPTLIQVRNYKKLLFSYNKNQLGTDRYLATITSYEKFGNDIVIIDIGTAITIDAIDNNRHVGLEIAPGLEKLRSTFSFHGQDSKQNFMLGTKNMVDGYINNAINNANKVIISGGGGQYLANTAKNIHYEQNLVLDGLVYYSLHFNI